MIKVITVGLLTAVFAFFVTAVAIAQTSTPTATPSPTTAPGAPSTGFGG